MSRSVTLNNMHVNLKTLTSIAGYNYLAIQPGVFEKYGETHATVKAAILLKCDYEQYDDTYRLSSDIDLRFTAVWLKRFIQLSLNSSIANTSVDGKKFFHKVYISDPETDKGYYYKDDGYVGWKYYSFAACGELLEGALFQRAEEALHYIDTPFIIFSEQDITASSDSRASTIQMVMNAGEIREYNKEQEKRYWQDRQNDKYLFNWVDNPEDYWNID